MYSWIWRNLPGPLPVRMAMATAVVLAVAIILWCQLFPWLSVHLSLCVG